MLTTAAPQDISEHPLIRDLLEIVSDLRLDRRDFVVFGSAPLLAHGVLRTIHDLDVVARGETWERAFQHGRLIHGDLNGASMAAYCDGTIQFSRGWISPDWNVDDLIDGAEFIGGLPFAPLDEVLRYKRELDRPKDRADIAAVDDMRFRYACVAPI